MVPETCVKQVPYTVCKPVCYTKTINCCEARAQVRALHGHAVRSGGGLQAGSGDRLLPGAALLPAELLRRNEGLRSGRLRQRLSKPVSSPGGREVWSSLNGGSTPQSRAAVVSWCRRARETRLNGPPAKPPVLLPLVDHQLGDLAGGRGQVDHLGLLGSQRHFISSLPSFSPRSPITMRSGMPIRSASLNFTPARTSRSSRAPRCRRPSIRRTAAPWPPSWPDRSP